MCPSKEAHSNFRPSSANASHRSFPNSSRPRPKRILRLPLSNTVPQEAVSCRPCQRNIIISSSSSINTIEACQSQPRPNLEAAGLCPEHSSA